MCARNFKSVKEFVCTVRVLWRECSSLWCIGSFENFSCIWRTSKDSCHRRIKFRLYRVGNFPRKELYHGLGIGNKSRELKLNQLRESDGILKQTSSVIAHARNSNVAFSLSSTNRVTDSRKKDYGKFTRGKHPFFLVSSNLVSCFDSRLSSMKSIVRNEAWVFEITQTSQPFNFYVQYFTSSRNINYLKLWSSFSFFLTPVRVSRAVRQPKVMLDSRRGWISSTNRCDWKPIRL